MTGLTVGAKIALFALCVLSAVSCERSASGPQGVQKNRDEEFKRLVSAAKEGNLSAIEESLAAGTDPNRVDAQGGTPLEYAAGSGKISAVRTLLANGANVRASSPDGYTALHAAAAGKEVAIVELLLAAGAEVNARTINNVTPLKASIGSPYSDSRVSLALIKAGADVNVADSTGETALLTAITDKSVEVVEELLNKGANPNVQSKSVGFPGNTPLHMAALNGLTKEVELLLHHGADPTVRNDEGQTPLDITNVKFEEVREMLSRALQSRTDK